jgi:hypothetical protein
MEDVDYFRRKLYRALNLPPSRIDPGGGFNLGRASEISRDEMRFIKFIKRMQIQFNNVFDQLLERQLRLKNIVTQEEWERIKDGIRYVWQEDSYFEELKAQEMWTSRLALLTSIEPYINKFFSTPWVTRNILKFTDDEWNAIHEDFDENPLVAGNTFDGEGEDGEDGEMGNAMLGDGEDGQDGEDGEKLPFGDEEMGDKEEKKPAFGGKPSFGKPKTDKKKPAFGGKPSGFGGKSK